MANLLKFVAVSFLLGLWHGSSPVAADNQQIAFSQSPAFRVVALDGGGGWCKSSVNLMVTVNDAAFFQGPGVTRLVVALGNTILPDLCPEATSLALNGSVGDDNFTVPIYQGKASRQQGWVLEASAPASIEPPVEKNAAASASSRPVGDSHYDKDGVANASSEKQGIRESSNITPTVTSVMGQHVSSPSIFHVGLVIILGSLVLAGGAFVGLRNRMPRRVALTTTAAVVLVGATAGAALWRSPEPETAPQSATPSQAAPSKAATPHPSPQAAKAAALPDPVKPSPVQKAEEPVKSTNKAELLKKLDMLDKLEVQELVAAAAKCVHAGDFSCAREKLAVAGRHAVDGEDRGWIAKNADWVEQVALELQRRREAEEKRRQEEAARARSVSYQVSVTSIIRTSDGCTFNAEKLYNGSVVERDIGACQRNSDGSYHIIFKGVIGTLWSSGNYNIDKRCDNASSMSGLGEAIKETVRCVWQN